MPFCVAVVLAAARPLSLLALAALPLAFAPVRQVRDGATGRSLIYALGQTGRLELAYGALLTARPGDQALAGRDRLGEAT